MSHKVTAIKCDYRRGQLHLTAMGESPRGTKVLLRKEVLAEFDPRNPTDRGKARAAVEKLLQRDPE
jgi:hypothetical protein